MLLPFLSVEAMAASSLKVCGPYQNPKKKSGVTGCRYSRKDCPFGQHRCGNCGALGHGGGDCSKQPISPKPWQNWVIQTKPPSPMPPPPPRQAPATSSTTVDLSTPRSKSKGWGNSSQPPDQDAVASGTSQPLPLASGTSQPPDHDAVASGTSQPPPLASETPTDEIIEGKGFKGYGKDGNFGA